MISCCLHCTQPFHCVKSHCHLPWCKCASFPCQYELFMLKNLSTSKVRIIFLFFPLNSKFALFQSSFFLVDLIAKWWIDISEIFLCLFTCLPHFMDILLLSTLDVSADTKSDDYNISIWTWRRPCHQLFLCFKHLVINLVLCFTKETVLIAESFLSYKVWSLP